LEGKLEFDLLNLLMKRRSIRIFKDEKVEKEMIQTIIKAGLLAPSSKNKKPVEFIIVEDKDTLLKLKDCKAKGNIGLKSAPCAIVVIGDSEKSDVWIEDASIAATYIQLEAENLGLGSVWIQMRKRFSEEGNSENEVKKLLNIPEKYGVLCIIAVGYKNDIIRPYIEDDIDFSKVKFERFES
jgi:nitroreductase